MKSGVLTWQDVQWLQSITKLPVLAKGILTAEDGKIHGIRLALKFSVWLT